MPSTPLLDARLAELLRIIRDPGLTPAPEPARPPGAEAPIVELLPIAGAAGAMRPPVEVRPPILEAGLVPLVPVLWALRPDDLLYLGFQSFNMRLEPREGRPPLLAPLEGRAAYLVVHLQPQHVGEQAFFEDGTTSEPPPNPPVHARLARPSRLAFSVPPGTVLEYSIAGLLDWTRLRLSVAPAALPAHPQPAELQPPPPLAAPKGTETAIEAPYRLTLSPSRLGAFAHARGPVTRNGRTELWHTRLAVRRADGSPDEAVEEERAVRAIWSPDYDPAVPGNPRPLSDVLTPFRMSLSPNDRYQLVVLSSSFAALPSVARPLPRRAEPVQVDRLMLSALGAWMNVRGAWAPPAGLSVEDWRHRATMGRDQYVRVVYKGYLFPFGHRAALIKVTERKLQPSPAGPQAAYLRQRMYLVVRQPVKRFGDELPDGGRRMPFKQVRITTLVTPSIEDPNTPAGGALGSYGQAAFFPRVQGQDFLFHLAAEDWDGRAVELTAPLVFTDATIAYQATDMNNVLGAYRATDEARRRRPLGGQEVAYAPSRAPGDTSYGTESVTFGAVVPPGALPQDQPRYWPTLEQAAVRIAIVEELSGHAAATRIELHPTYLASGLVKGEVFARLVDPVPLTFTGAGSADKSGGLATPNMTLSGLSRLVGVVGGDASRWADAAQFDPADVFGALQGAKLLGAVELGDIVEAVAGDLLGQLDKLPGFFRRKVDSGIEVGFAWHPNVHAWPSGGDAIFLPRNPPDDTFVVSAKLTKTFDASPAAYEARADLKNFEIHILPQVIEVLVVPVKSISFVAKSGSKPDISAEVGDVRFTGPLSFVNKLSEIISTFGGGFKDPPNIYVDQKGIHAGFSVAIPPVTIGVLSLKNISFGAAIDLPFVGDPLTLRFNFAERQSPFTLAVWIFGGSGFFALTASPSQIEVLEASFEFGAMFCLDLGVASGEAHLTAGIYYRMEGDKATLTGFVRLGGSLDVLGLIHVSLEFDLTLTYRSDTGKVWGQATLTVEIDVLFFSVSVDVTVEKQFKGSSGDPTIAAMLTQGDWDRYCDAFA